jgi:hypothetical protein
MDPIAWRYNWIDLFLWYTNTGTWPSRLESRFWDSKIWSWDPRNSDPETTALARANSNRKWQNRSHVRGGAPYQQTHNCLTVIKFWSWTPDVWLTPRHTGQLTVGCNITLILTLTYQYVRWSLVLFPSLTSPYTGFWNVCVYCDRWDQCLARQSRDKHLLA